MLAYKPNEVSPFGDMSLFLSMERAKLVYLTIKSTFKINYLQQLGIDILVLNNNFEKFGEGGEGQMVRGGLNGTFLIDRWYNFGFFTDIDMLRNYCGDVLAHELLVRISIIGFLLVISVFYTPIFIYEKLYTDLVYLYTTLLSAAIFAISFSIFTLYL